VTIFIYLSGRLVDYGVGKLWVVKYGGWCDEIGLLDGSGRIYQWRRLIGVSEITLGGDGGSFGMMCSWLAFFVGIMAHPG
jgi:hypothetical protein